MQATIFFKALSNPTRLKLILKLRERDALCVCEMTSQLDQPQPTISRHLSQLKNANIVISERRGTWMWYALNPDMPKWWWQVIHSIDIHHTDDTNFYNKMTKMNT